jgi:hypothetical protein
MDLHSFGRPLTSNIQRGAGSDATRKVRDSPLSARGSLKITAYLVSLIPELPSSPECRTRLTLKTLHQALTREAFLIRGIGQKPETSSS